MSLSQQHDTKKELRQLRQRRLQTLACFGYFITNLFEGKPGNEYYNAIVMTDPVKKVKDASQDAEAKMKTSEAHTEGKPSSETINKAKVKVRDALT
jgi:hypothetical protein